MDRQWTSCRVQALNLESTANAAMRIASLNIASAPEGRYVGEEISHRFLATSALKLACGSLMQQVSLKTDHLTHEIGSIVATYHFSSGYGQQASERRFG